MVVGRNVGESAFEVVGRGDDAGRKRRQWATLYRDGYSLAGISACMGAGDPVAQLLESAIFPSCSTTAYGAAGLRRHGPGIPGVFGKRVQYAGAERRTLAKLANAAPKV